MMLSSGSRVFAESVESETVLSRVVGVQKGRLELCPLGFTDVTLEDTKLNSLAVVFAKASDFSKTSAAFRSDCRDIVADENDHNSSWGL